MAYQRYEHIPAGQFRAGKNEEDIYQAFLGTCVGVSLFDRSKNIGGLIHILLPEPLSGSDVTAPEKYAATGIPMLLEELTALGADPHSMDACVAGGALVGPVSRQDMNLDIGGRSAEIAIFLLRKAGVKSLKSETGGFFTCTLELNMKTGESAINPAWEDQAKSENRIPPPTIEDIIQTIGLLKPIPQTALKILRMVQSGRSNIAEVTGELSKDQVLSGQTLKLCNSALFAGLIKIDTLKDAVLIMGEAMLVKSVITAAVNTYYNQTGVSGYSLCKGGLFFHAVGVAWTAEKIAEKSGQSSRKMAYTAGLLHDIGKVVLDQYVADRAPLFFRKITQENGNFKTLEKSLIGISHCEAGALLAKNWQFSDALSETIRFHHEPEQAKAHKDIVCTVYLADLLMEKFNAGFEIEKMQTQSLDAALSHLGLSRSDLPELIDAIPINEINNSDLLSAQR